jgi:CheY-like chemotaxis protein
MTAPFAPIVSLRGNCDIVDPIIQRIARRAPVRIEKQALQWAKLVQPILRSDAEAPVREDGGVSTPNGRSRCRLVLLEDNDSVRIATEMFLTLEGFETRTAATVADAQILLVGMQPGDVLITDYHLDGKLTGLDVLQQLRIQHGRDVPAILLSGDLPSMMRVVKTSIPHCRFLGKPVNTKALLSAIGELSVS